MRQNFKSTKDNRKIYLYSFKLGHENIFDYQYYKKLNGYTYTEHNPIFELG